MEHPNVVRLVDHYYGSERDTQYLHLVMEVYSCSLHGLIRQRTVQQGLVPLYLYQVLNGLSHLHHLHIMHRDLTPSNLLLHQDTQRLVIADLGSAKVNQTYENSLSYVCSRAYRAP